ATGILVSNGSGTPGQVVFSILGNGAGSGTITFQVTNGTTTAGYSVSYTAGEPFTATLGAGSAGPKTVAVRGTNDVVVNVAAASGFTGSITINAPPSGSLVGITGVSPGSTQSCSGTCTVTFRLSGGSTQTVLTSVNYTVSAGSYSVNLGSQY